MDRQRDRQSGHVMSRQSTRVTNPQYSTNPPVNANDNFRLKFHHFPIEN